MRETIKMANRFISASPWKNYLIGPFGDLADANDDSRLDAYVAANAGAFFHPIGSAQMSHKDAKYGVTNPDLTVKGVQGLRIIDASIMVRNVLHLIQIFLIALAALPSECPPPSSSLPHC